MTKKQQKFNTLIFWINDDYIPKEHKPVGLQNGDSVF